MKIGNTIITCGVKGMIAQPKLQTPNDGYIGKSIQVNFKLLILIFVVPNIDLPPICSPKFKPGAPSVLTQCLSDHLSNIVQKYVFYLLSFNIYK